LGYSILKKDWNASGQQIKPSCKTVGNVHRVNALLNKEKQKALDLFTQLQAEGRLETLSFGEIKQMMQGQGSTLMTLAYGQEVIDQMKEAGKHGNARVYKTMLRSIASFADEKDFPLSQLSYRWLKKYESWYLGKGNSVNGLSVSLRTLRALFNRAIKEKRVDAKYYPFNDYQIKQEETRKRALSLDELQKIRKFEPQTDRQRRAKDYFLLSFYLMGASFVDLAFLRGKNIIGGRIEYKRRKTGRLHSIPISAAVQEILDRYLKDKKGDDFILNVVTSPDPAKQGVQVRDELRRYNRTLKEMATLCGIESHLTSYAARHSYATIAKYKGVPTAVISEALGHKSESITQVYLASFDKDVLDKYHNMIIE
jgi:integrase